MLTGVVLASAVVIVLPLGAASANDKHGETERSQCVSSPVVRSQIVDDRTIAIRDAQGNSAILTLSGPCLHDRNELVQIRLSGTSSQICHANDADIVGNAGTNTPLSCSVKSIKFLPRDNEESR
jgi:hypothetical protein